METSLTTSLTDHKAKKTYEKVIIDIKGMLQVLSLTHRGLVVFKNYIIMQEIISVIHTNITLLELKLKDYEKKLKEIKDKE
jgi:hypothetical protein